MGVGMYRIRVVGELDSSKIRAELDALSKQYGAFGAGTGGKGGVYGATGKSAEKAGKQIKGANQQIIASQKGMKGLGHETLNVTKKVIQFGAVTAIIRGVTSGIGDMVQKTFELDEALTEFKKVSDLSGKGLEKYTDQAFKMGRSVAKTGTEMIEAATEFRKSGFNDQDSLKLGQVAMMFSNIADSELSAGDAAGFITSQFKASFKDISTDATKASQQVIDAINEVSNTQAVSSTDLSMAMSKVASAMKVNNNTYAQSLGMVTAGTEIMHGQASKVGRGLRTIGANISKLQKDSKTLEVQTKDGVKTIDLWDKKTNEIKSTYDVFKEFAGVWDDMTPDQQQALSLQMAGKNQQEVFASVIGNWKNAEKAAETATQQINEGGSALKENAKYLQSMEGHLENLKSAWSEFSNAMVKSDWLNKGMDMLAKILRFLSSDTGKALIKITLFSTGINLLAKALLGLKGLSIVTLVKDITKIGKGAEGASKGITPLLNVFSKLTGSLLGSAGLITGIGLLSVALAEFVPIGEAAADIRLGKELKKAQSDVEETEKKYESLNDELEKLKEKEKEGTLTDSEANRLTILENQTKQLERQLELKKQMAQNKADEYYHNVSVKDANELSGTAKANYISAKRSGYSDKAALAAAGIHDKIALALNKEQAQAEKTQEAEEALVYAYEHYGEDSKEYEKALDDLTKAQDEQGDSLKQLEKKREKAIKDYGSEENASKKLGQSWKDLNKEIRVLKALQGINFKKPAKDMKTLKENSHALGLYFGKAGKNIKSLDLETFSSEMTKAGYSVEDTYEYLKALGEENPKMKVEIDGTKVAIDDLGFLDGKIQEITGEPKEVNVQSDKAMKRAGELEDKLDKIDKTTVAPPIKPNVDQKPLKDLQKEWNTLKQDKSVNVKVNTSGLGLLKTLKSWIDKIKSKTVNIRAKKHVGGSGGHASDEAHGVRHFASGGIMPNAQVNEQGFEIIRDDATGMMRVINGGKRGYTYLNRGDSVYTHNQSLRMLRNAGITEGQAIYGHGNSDFALFGVQRLKGYAKGKLTQKQYNKKYKNLQEAMEKDIATLEYKRDYYAWTDAEFAKNYKKVYNKYRKKLKNLNKSAVKKGVKKKKTLGTDLERDYKLSQREVKQEQSAEDIESLIANTRGTANDLEEALRAISAADKAQLISAEDAKKYKMEAYKKYVDYTLKQYKNDKEYYSKSLQLLKEYYKDGKISGEDFYEYMDELAQEQLDKEKERLGERQEKLENTYDLARAYVQRQIDLLEVENDEQQEQNELIELQNNLAKARSQRVRVYKEGEGFVYEKDTEAIREATQALQDYQASSTTTNPVLKQWQDILKLFDEAEADAQIRQLERLVGGDVGTLFGGLGTDTGAWSNWIRGNLSETGGLIEVLRTLDGLVDTDDIINFLDSDGRVSDAIIAAAISDNILPETYAAAVTKAAMGGSLSANTVAGLASASGIASMANGMIVTGGTVQYNNTFNFDSLVLPNVNNAQDFVSELGNLANKALQSALGRK